MLSAFIERRTGRHENACFRFIIHPVFSRLFYRFDHGIPLQLGKAETFPCHAVPRFTVRQGDIFFGNRGTAVRRFRIGENNILVPLLAEDDIVTPRCVNRNRTNAVRFVADIPCSALLHRRIDEGDLLIGFSHFPRYPSAECVSLPKCGGKSVFFPVSIAVTAVRKNGTVFALKNAAQLIESYRIRFGGGDRRYEQIAFYIGKIRPVPNDLITDLAVRLRELVYRAAGGHRI